MSFLAVSHVVMWVLLVVLAVITFVLVRQIGVLYERVAPAGALAVNKNLEVGQAAPELLLPTLAGDLITIGGADKEGKSSLVFFISPDCPVCKTLLPALQSAARAEAGWMRVVLASDGPEQDHQGYVKEHGLGGFPYVVSEVLGKTYGVAKLPYAVVIDERGKVAALGIVNSREHLDSLFEAKERGVGSIQDYLGKRSGVVLGEKAE